MRCEDGAGRTRGFWMVALMGLLAPAGAWAGGQASFSVTNGLDVARKGEIVELPWADVVRQCPTAVAGAVRVMDEAGKELASQKVDEDGDGSADELIFQADFSAGQTRKLVVGCGPAAAKIPSKVHAVFVPQRADDFAWENDKIAFRIYGPGLIKIDGPCSGIDVWCKHVPDLIVDAMYKKDKYHVDDGKGVDCYKVNPTRGCGGIAVFNGGKKYVGANFTTWKILAEGPLRTVFRLEYAAFDAGGVRVTETKTVSLDAGSQLNKFESAFKLEGAGDLMVAPGLALHKDPHVDSSAEQGWVSAWVGTDGKDNGMIGTAIVVPAGLAKEVKTIEKDAFIFVPLQADQKFVYHAGAGWSKAGFKDRAAWVKYVEEFVKRAGSPVKVEWK